MSTKETAGKIYSDLRSKIQQDKITIPDFVQAQGDDIMPKVFDAIAKKKLTAQKDFFIELPIWMHPLFHGVPCCLIIPRDTCPTPFYDRAVFHYDKKKDATFTLWFIPSYEECVYYEKNKLYLQPYEMEAANHAAEFKKGTYLRLAKSLNGEINDYELIFHRKDENGQPITPGTSIPSGNTPRK